MHEEHMAHDHDAMEMKDDYKSLFILFGLIVLVVLTVNLKEILGGVLDLNHVMTAFMAGFFLVFSGLKLLNVKAFVDGFAAYDIVTKRFRVYGFIYPFLELGLGLAYLSGYANSLVLWVTILLMLVSSLGVIQSLLKKNHIRCACTGGFLNLPVGWVTLVEDGGMFLMAVMMLMKL